MSQVQDYVRLFGFPCEECGHDHAGKLCAFICIGCKCERRMPSPVSIAHIERVLLHKQKEKA